MLVLTRNIGERLIIDEGKVKIKILEVKGTHVRIGVEAPNEISIHREEVFNQIQQKKQNKEEKV